MSVLVDGEACAGTRCAMAVGTGFSRTDPSFDTVSTRRAVIAGTPTLGPASKLALAGRHTTRAAGRVRDSCECLWAAGGRRDTPECDSLRRGQQILSKRVHHTRIFVVRHASEDLRYIQPASDKSRSGPRHLTNFARYWILGRCRAEDSSRVAAEVWVGWSLLERHACQEQCRKAGGGFVTRPVRPTTAKALRSGKCPVPRGGLA
jgi:hypothetical protein